MKRESIGHTFLVAILLCLFCSFLVSAAAVGLRDIQQANKERERKRNILVVAGLFTDGKTSADDIESIYDKNVIAILVDLNQGTVVDASEIDGLTMPYDQRRASSDATLSAPLDRSDDIASLIRREKYSAVYLVEKPDGSQLIVLPIRGYGLWSTLWGFLALDGDGNTIRGLTYYDHAETPGLGGEVDNPDWKAKWQGKLAFDADGKVSIQVIKGTVLPNDPEKDFKVDGLAGATITSRGVSNMLEFWLGANGFGPYLKWRAEGGGDD
jgi:Na+-transporting NADH:ubiquinone oxidoreductase subunit C